MQVIRLIRDPSLSVLIDAHATPKSESFRAGSRVPHVAITNLPT